MRPAILVLFSILFVTFASEIPRDKDGSRDSRQLDFLRDVTLPSPPATFVAIFGAELFRQGVTNAISMRQLEELQLQDAAIQKNMDAVKEALLAIESLTASRSYRLPVTCDQSELIRLASDIYNEAHNNPSSPTISENVKKILDMLGSCSKAQMQTIKSRLTDAYAKLEEFKKEIEVKIEGLGGTITIATTTKISSPNYPYDYPADSHIEYVLTAPKGQTPFTISFKDFELEDCGADCDCDWVKIVDGNGQDLLPKTCGAEIPDKIISETQTATLTFVSDDDNDDVVYKGFRAELSAVVLITVTPVTD